MAGKVNVPLTVAVSGLAKSIAQLNSLGKAVGAVAKTAGLAAVGFGAFTAGIKFGDFAVNAVAGARDLERNLAGLETVFGDLTPQMQDFSKRASEMGLSINEASKSSVFIGSVLKQSGFAIDETANLTERLVGLATDLSITYGYDVQEALLGMTALFRGEYDPIEKFGVAMKQSEINAELAAKGLSHLEGAERRLAEQQIRLELLFQRSADAQGAFQRQSGTLATEQLKLAASFANVKDTVATSLLPVIADFMMELQTVVTDIQPELRNLFENMAPVLERVANDLVPVLVDGLNLFLDILDESVQLIEQMTNPFTDVGESVEALGIQFGSLFSTITGGQLTTESSFDIIGAAVGMVIDFIHDLLYLIENTVIGFQVMGEMAHALFTGDWTKLFSTDWAGQITAQIALKDAFNAQALAVAKLNQEIEDQESALKKANRAWSNSWIARGEWAKEQGLVADLEDAFFGGDGDGGGGGGERAKKVKDYVADLFSNLQDEVQKQTARLQLEQMGASEGLIGLILGSEGWMKIWLQIKQGTISLKDLEKQYYRTAAGAKELADEAAEAKRQWQEYDDAIAAIQENLDRELASIAEHFDEVRLSFSDMIAEFDTLATVEVELGKFESSVAQYAESISSSLEEAFRAGDILESGYRELQAYADKELAILAGIQRQRDELAERYSFSESMIKEYRSAFTSALNLTNLFSSLSEETQTRTVNEVSKGVVQLGSDLRAFNVTVTRSYEQTLDSVSDKSQGLLDGFRNMAEKSRAFADNLRKLRDLGLDPMLFNQLVEAGVEAGGETAQALVDGGSATISEINALFQEIDALGAQLGFDVSETYYDTGSELIDALLAGMRSQQTALEQQAKDFADSFNTAFQGSLNIAIGSAQKAQEDAKKAVAADEIAKVPVPTVPRPVDQASLDQLDALIKRAGQYADNINDATKAAGALVKQDIYEQLREVVATGGTVDLSGIQSGMSSAELAQAAAQASGGSVTYNVNVTADTRLSGAKAGEAVVQQLSSFQSASGNFQSYLK